MLKIVITHIHTHTIFRRPRQRPSTVSCDEPSESAPRGFHPVNTWLYGVT